MINKHNKTFLVLLMMTVFVCVHSNGFAASAKAKRLAQAYQKALASGDQKKIEAAWKNLHTNPEAVQVLRETNANAYNDYAEFTNKINESKRMRAQNPDQVRQQREARSQERVQQRHPEIFEKDELAKAVETVHNNPNSTAANVEEARGLTAKKHEVVDSRRFAGGDAAVPGEQYASHKAHADQVVTDATQKAAAEHGYNPGEQAKTGGSKSVPKPKSDWDMYHGVIEETLPDGSPNPAYKEGQPRRLTREGQKKMRESMKNNMNEYMQERGQTPMTDGEFVNKKIDPLPAQVEKIGIHGNNDDFKIYAESANATKMEMYTDGVAVEAEQIQRGMKEGKITLEHAGAYGAEQHRQERHHRNLGKEANQTYQEARGKAGAQAADQRVFSATEVDAEGSKVGKHIGREHQGRAEAAKAIESEYGVRIENPEAPYSQEMKDSIKQAQKRSSVAEVEYDAARAAGMDDYIMEHEARTTAEFATNAQNKVPALQDDAAKGIARRAQPLNANQRAEVLEIARREGGEQFAQKVRQEMIAMEKADQAFGKNTHHGHVDPKIKAEIEAGKLKGKSSSSYVETAAERAAAESSSGMLSNAAGQAADAMRARGVRVPTQGQVMEGMGKGMDGAMIAGMAAHGVEQEREEAAEEGRAFDPMRAAANATVRGSYEGGKMVGEQEVDESDRRGESRVWAAGRVAGRTADGLSGYSENQDKFAQEAERQRAQAEAEARELDAYDEAAYRARATARSMPLHDMTEDIIREEMQREVDEHGADASPAMAKARAAARVIPEALHTQAVFEMPYTDTEAIRQSGETQRRLDERRQDAILDMDNGLHDIALIEQRMRNLDQNKNQNDPWVQQRRQELQNEYNQKREQLQRMNQTLGKDAPNSGEARAIRDAVALLPERNQTQDPVDELAQAMFDSADSPEAIGRWKDEGYMDHGATTTFKDDFRGKDAAGRSAQDKFDSDTRVISDPTDMISIDDYEQHMQGKRDTRRAADAQKEQIMRDMQDQYNAGWQATMDQVNATIAQQNKADADKLKAKTQEAVALIQQMQNGAISDEDFTNKLNQLKDEYTGLKQQGQQAWDNIVNGLVNGQINNGQGIPALGNTGDPGNDILSSVPADQIDTRTVVCDTHSKSGNNTPASISVDMKGGTGTATLKHTFYSVKDRIVIQVNGGTVTDTGCISGSASIPISVSGGDQVRVIVQPACEGSSSTDWNFSVSCPAQTLGAAPSGFVNKGYKVMTNDQMQNTTFGQVATGYTPGDMIIKPNTSYNANGGSSNNNGMYIK